MYRNSSSSRHSRPAWGEGHFTSLVFLEGWEMPHREIPQKTGITVRVVRCLRYTFLGDKKPISTHNKTQNQEWARRLLYWSKECLYIYINIWINIYIYSRNAQLFLNKYLYIYIYYIIYRYKVSVYNPNKSSEKWSRVDLDLNLNFKNILCWQPTGWQIGEKEN